MSYRNRIYDNYVYGRHQPLAAPTVAALDPRAAYLRNMIRSHFPADKSSAVLDLGCGHGALLYFAREAGYNNVRGVDGSAQQVALASQLGIEGIEHRDLFDALAQQPESSLDAIIAFDVIEHFTRDELIIFVDAVHRALRPGARWLIHTPNAESPFGAHIRYADITHELAFTRTSLAQLLISSGFRSVKSYEDVPAVHGIRSGARWILWKGIRLLLRIYVAVETGGGTQSIFSQNFLTIAVK